MHVLKGRVRDGVIVPDEPDALEEGEVVEIRKAKPKANAAETKAAKTFKVPADLAPVLRESIAQADRGESIDADDVLRELDGI